MGPAVTAVVSVCSATARGVTARDTGATFVPNMRHRGIIVLPRAMGVAGKRVENVVREQGLSF